MTVAGPGDDERVAISSKSKVAVVIQVRMVKLTSDGISEIGIYICFYASALISYSTGGTSHGSLRLFFPRKNFPAQAEVTARDSKA